MGGPCRQRVKIHLADADERKPRGVQPIGILARLELAAPRQGIGLLQLRNFLCEALFSPWLGTTVEPVT